MKHNNEVNMLLISNNDKRWVSINRSKQNKSYNCNGIRYITDTTLYEELTHKMETMNRTWLYRFKDKPNVINKTYNVVNVAVGSCSNLEQRYIGDYVRKLSRPRVGLIIVKDMIECESIISEDNKTHFKVDCNTSKRGAGDDPRNSIFENATVENGLYKFERSYRMGTGNNPKRFIRYSEGNGYLYTNYVPGKTKALTIPDDILLNPMRFLELKNKASCTLLIIDVDYLIEKYPLIGNMFDGVKSFCTIEAFKILNDELWYTYLNDFEENNDGIRILPTPFTYTIVDLNNTIREKNVKSNEMNPVEKINSITRIAGIDNQSIGIDNNSYTEVLPHCETTTKIQTYMRMIKRLCRGIKLDQSNLTDDEKIKQDKSNVHNLNLAKKVYEEIKVLWLDRVNKNLPNKIIDEVHNINFKINLELNTVEFIPSEESYTEEQVVALIDRYGSDCSIEKLTQTKNSYKFENDFIDIFDRPRGRRWELKNNQKSKFSTKIQRRFHSTKITNDITIVKDNKLISKLNETRGYTYYRKFKTSNIDEIKILSSIHANANHSSECTINKSNFANANHSNECTIHKSIELITAKVDFNSFYPKK